MKRLTIREFQLQAGTLTPEDCPITITRYGKDLFVLNSTQAPQMTANEILWKGEHQKIKGLYDKVLDDYAALCDIVRRRAMQDGEYVDIQEMISEYKEMNNAEVEEYLED